MPDKEGSTPVHVSASMGHTAILKHLIDNGGNIWALDNQGQTPAMAAATRRHGECFKYLDSLSVRLQVESPGLVKKLQQKASKEAEKRLKQARKKQIEQSRLQTPTVAKEAGKLGKKSKTVAKLPFAIEGLSDHVHSTSIRPSTVSGYRQRLITEPQISKQGDMKLNTARRQVALGNFVLKPANTAEEADNSKTMTTLDETDSEHTGHGLRRVGSTGSIQTGTIFSDQDHEKTETTITGMFQQEGPSAIGRLNSMSALQHSQLEGPSPSPSTNIPQSDPLDLARSPQRNPRTRSHSLPQRAQGHQTAADPVTDIQEPDETEVDSPLTSFLATLGLEGIAPLLEQERIDLDALTLCSDSDLKEINVPLGPRRKIMAAIKRRKGDLQTPGTLTDTSL